MGSTKMRNLLVCTGLEDFAVENQYPVYVGVERRRRKKCQKEERS